MARTGGGVHEDFAAGLRRRPSRNSAFPGRWWAVGRRQGQLGQANGEQGGVDLGGSLDDGDGAELAGAERAAQRVGAPDFADEVAPGFASAWAAGGGVAGDGGRAGARRSQGGGGAGDAGFVTVVTVVADLGAAGHGDLGEQGADEIEGGKDLKVAAGAPVALGAVEDGAGLGLVGDFLEGVGRAEQIFGEAAAALGIVGGKRGFAAVGTKTGVSPLEEAGEGLGREGAGLAKAAEQSEAPEFTERLTPFSPPPSAAVPDKPSAASRWRP
jgi:hypothetical protein